MVMLPMGEDTFGFAEVDYFRVRFERDERGQVTRLVGMYSDGHTDVNPREN